MDMTEHLTSVIVVMVIVLIGLVVFVFLIDPIFFGGTFVRKIVCGAMFWIPFGNIFKALTHGCAIIPA
ncbi:MAG: hypothetical protein ABIE55_04495 [Candidatus Aenigmatarchaeota archaeon]